MKIYNEQIALQSQKRSDVFNITTQVKAAAEKSGLRDGIVVASAFHSNTALVVCGDDAKTRAELQSWLAELDESESARQAGGILQRAPAVYFPTLFLQHQVAVPITDGRLEIESGQALLFIDLEGFRPRRVVIKILGE
jgi:secondary thiamine-phosphate synthase enzyme